MDKREAVIRSVQFEEPDWVPYEIGISLRYLRAHYSDSVIDTLRDSLLMLGAVQHDDAMIAQDLFAQASPTPNPPPTPYRPLEEGEWVDEWGTIWTNADFPRVSGHPLAESWGLLDEYTLPDPLAPGRYEEARRNLQRKPDRYRRGSVWFTLFERLWMLRGFDNALMDPYLHPDRFIQLRDLIIDFNLASIRRQLALGVDGIYISDDWGTQQNLLIKPSDWRIWYKPQYERMFDAIHQGGAHVWMHLCGNVVSILPDLIEVGLDVLNPIQPQAMDVDALAAEFGGQICFFGGADVQGTLPHGTPEDVRQEVQHLIDIFGRYSGGYIGCTSHSILPDTPPENIIALFKAFRDCTGFG